MITPEFTALTALTDLASRALGGSVSTANDELFAQRENLIRAEVPFFDPNEFGHKGKVYDGWETRRRRSAAPDPAAHDYAIVRLGAAGIIHGVVVDTAYFKGNYPPFISVEAASVEGYPSVEEMLNADWETIVKKSPAEGDTANTYPVGDRRHWTHVRLCIYPDGGVARLRVYGEVVPDPRFLTGTVDLLAAETGGRLVGCSDAFYASPANIILPGRARNMGEGWENARRRGDGNDYAIFALAAAGHPRYAEVDTSYYVGNAPGWIRLSTLDARTADVDDAEAWTDVLARTAVQPDTRHRFLLDGAVAATHVRLDVYPDGGLSRLRLFGDLDDSALTDARRVWWDALPASHQTQVSDQSPRTN
jgi:allantoicase